MTTFTVRFETENKMILNKSAQIDFVANLCKESRVRMVKELENVFIGKNLKFGFGGSHVWCANSDNVRQFIIELR